MALLAALAFRDGGNLLAAKAELARILQENARDPEALNIAGMLAHDALQLDEAALHFRKALESAPESARIHYNLALVLLLMGNYAEGWREFAWRERIPGPANFSNVPFGIPRWSGQPLQGRRILVHAEQGLGDTMQFARFLGILESQGAEVELFCHAPLVPLLSRVAGVASSVSELIVQPNHDFHAAIGDITAHFLPDLHSPHWHGPYISALDSRIARWDARIPTSPGRRIGLVWRGNPCTSTIGTDPSPRPMPTR